jgi:DeoR family fructose operon transcriptional repressor
VEVNQLADDLDVTPETVRRDQTALERLGVLRRFHGGAIPMGRLGVERAVAEREKGSPGRRSGSPVNDTSAVVLERFRVVERVARAAP